VGGWITPRVTEDINLVVDLSDTNRSFIENGLFKDLTDAGFKGSLQLSAPEDDIKLCIKVISAEDTPVDIIIAGRKWEDEIIQDNLSIEVLKGVSIPVVKPEGLIVLKLRAGSFQNITDASKLLTDAEYNRQKLLALAKRASVEKKLLRLMKSLGVT